MIEAIVFIKRGKMYVIGMDTEKPVYYPITHIELKQLLQNSTDDQWDNVLAPTQAETQDTIFPAENAMSAETDA